MDQEQVIRNLRLQLLVERIIIAVAAFILLSCWVYGRLANAKSFIVVDGRPVVCVPSEQVAQGILQDIKSETGYDPKEIQFKQEVQVARAPRNANPVSRHKAIRLVKHYVSPVVPRWAVIVDGKPIAAVPSREVAGEVLDLAKLKFGKLAKNLAEEPQFKERVTVDITAVDPVVYRKTAAEALDLLFSKPKSIEKDAVYTVQQGDTASHIADKHELRLAQLEQLNPGLRLERLAIGDQLRIKTTESGKPKITVVVRDLGERTETIPAPVQSVSSAQLYSGKTAELSPGRNGQRRVKIAMIYENGIKVGSEVIEEEILREPIPKRIAVGIKAR